MTRSNLQYVGALIALVCLASTGVEGQSACSFWSLIDGGGYTSHTECDKFIQCGLNASSAFVEEVRQCAFPTYWNQTLLTCVHAEQENCPNDQCLMYNLPDKTVRSAEGNCRGYWECMNGRSVPKCCPIGKMYNDTDGECVDIMEDECMDICFSDEVEQNETMCDKRPVGGHLNWFEWEIYEGIWTMMPCAPGTVYSQSECECVSPDAAQPVTVPPPICRPEIHLPFTTNTNDVTGRGRIHIGNENVFVSDGAAVFRGNGRLSIPRFNNIEHVTSLYIDITYTSDHTANAGLARALVTNDCGNNPSIMISEDASNIYFGVGTTKAPFNFTAVPHKPMEATETTLSTKHVTYEFNNGMLTGSNGRNASEVDATGYLRSEKCALYIGYGENLAPFVGTIDDIKIFLNCVPEMNMQPL